MALIRTVLNPLLTAPAYFLLRQAPPSVREPIIRHLAPYLSISRLATALKYLSLLGLVRWMNAYLSTWAENNFRLASERHRYHWPDEIAVVTGGTGGFGSLICKYLAAEGITVICVDITDGMPEDMRSNPKIHYQKCDIVSPGAVSQLGDTIKREYGDPSILVNNAGIGLSHSVLSATPSALKKIYDVNLFSHYYLLQQFLPAMIANKKGHVISMASMAAFISQAGMSSYAGTKAAVLVLHESLKQETRVINSAPEVLFSIIHPTFSDTPIYRQFKAEIDAGMNGRTAMVTPQEVANAVVRQVMRCRGEQVVLGGGVGWISGVRGWPQILQQIVFRAIDDGVRRSHAAGMAQRGVKA